MMRMMMMMMMMMMKIMWKTPPIFFSIQFYATYGWLCFQNHALYFRKQSYFVWGYQFINFKCTCLCSSKKEVSSKRQLYEPQFDWFLKNPSQPRPEILETRHFRCRRNYENCLVKPNLIAAPQYRKSVKPPLAVSWQSLSFWHAPSKI